MTALHAVDSAPGLTLGQAVSAYLETQKNKGTRAQYASTLGRLVAHLGAGIPLASVSAGQLENFVAATFGHLAPNTRNRAVKVLGGAWAWFGGEAGQAAVAGLALVKVRDDIDRAVPVAVVQHLVSGGWLARDATAEQREIALRDRALYALLWESGARVAEVLRLNVEDLLRDRHIARVTRKGGFEDYITWQSGFADLLPRMLKGRRSGPLFVTARPQPVTVVLNHVPDGRRRLSYSRAEEVFKDRTRGLEGGPWTLHGLRHAAICRLMRQGTSTPLMMRFSGHSRVETLHRYARATIEDLAAVQAENDPGRR